MSEQRLIDANTLPVHRCTLIGSDGFEYETEIIYKFDIDDAPTINVEPRIIHKPTTSEFKRIAIQLGYEPVVHGHWILHKPRRLNRNATYKCSVCKKLRSSYYNDVGNWEYCPCGAKMKGTD